MHDIGREHHQESDGLTPKSRDRSKPHLRVREDHIPHAHQLLIPRIVHHRARVQGIVDAAAALVPLPVRGPGGLDGAVRDDVPAAIATQGTRSVDAVRRESRE